MSSVPSPSTSKVKSPTVYPAGISTGLGSESASLSIKLSPKNTVSFGASSIDSPALNITTSQLVVIMIPCFLADNENVVKLEFVDPLSTLVKNKDGLTPVHVEKSPAPG